MAANAIEVSAGLIFRSGKLLITRRHADSHLGGLWEFPGGKREPCETFEQCLVRELREELDIEVRVGRVLADLTHAYAEKTVRLRFFLCRLETGEPQPLGCAAIKWVGREELQAHDFPAADARLLEKLKATPEFWQSRAQPAGTTGASRQQGTCNSGKLKADGLNVVNPKPAPLRSRGSPHSRKSGDSREIQ